MSIAHRRAMRTTSLAASLALVAVLGCMASATVDTESDDLITDSQALAVQAIADGSLDAIRALRTANTASVTVLRRDARLTTPAAQNIVARRNGADGIAATADDRPFYTLAELDAVREIGPAMIGRLATYGAAHPEIFGTALRVGALPPELASDPDAAGLIGAIAADSSLMIDGDPSTLLSSEWELGLLFAHHFAPTTAARVAKLRGYLFGSDVRRGPFIDIATMDREMFGEGEPSWALAALLARTAADPQHTAGRIYAPELEAALADAGFVARNPGVLFLQQQFLAIWTAQVEVTDPGDLPLGLAFTRELLRSRGVATFSAPYPDDIQMWPILAALPLAMPFERGTEIVCMQGNNSMAAQSSHAPDQLRYALDLNAPFGTTIVASAPGTAYVYDNARPSSFDNFGFGNILLIDQHNGYALLHAHVNTFAVANGQSVTAGQVVGTVGVTGAAGNAPHVHFQVVPLFRTPDPDNEEYQSDVPVPASTPFGSPEMFLMSAIDVTAGTPAAVIPSHGFTCGESGWLPGRAHIYRSP
jgi:murein DD-endopeptidase MepM/ murein hydrolase activator NlpD